MDREEKQGNQINLCKPPCYDHLSCESNALYYRSNVDQKEYILLLRSRAGTQQICKYDIDGDEYIDISSNKLSFALKSSKLSHIIYAPHPLLTICAHKNQISVLNLHNFEYFDNYQQSNCSDSLSSSSSLVITVWTILFAIFFCNTSILIALFYTLIFYILSIKISQFAQQFAQDIKCVIYRPQFEYLYNVQSCVVDNESIHFVANINDAKKRGILTHFCFDLKARHFIKLQPVNVNIAIDEKSEVSPYKIVYIKCTKTLIMFTNSPCIWYYGLNDDEMRWRIFEDVKLPKIPGPQYNVNIIIGFKGIIFLFYYENATKHEVESIESDDTFTYCWDLLFSGNMFECDNKYPLNTIHKECVAVNTDDNWTHFIGDSPVPFHFKIALHNEIPVELTIIHLQYFHILIKQYILETVKHKITNDVEMLILDYFPMFL